MEEAKQLIKEAVIWPIAKRDMFLRMGINPPKGIPTMVVIFEQVFFRNFTLWSSWMQQDIVSQGNCDRIKYEFYCDQGSRVAESIFGSK